MDDFSQEDVPRAEQIRARRASGASGRGRGKTKLLENTFRAVAIALANKFADICGLWISR
ncbi:hypothetical protein [Arthrobacter sp. ZGTC212]|uniref:hypothetical protein n=1 Tax=Arthrobacter sp. ZGTC212 TaxID=2058899 RepID=UPI002157C3A2|nr:hypothetical protein [Arthrobacter sp. ZGTC212]